MKAKYLQYITLYEEFLDGQFPNMEREAQALAWAKAHYGEDFIALGKWYDDLTDPRLMTSQPYTLKPVSGGWKIKVCIWKETDAA